MVFTDLLHSIYSIFYPQQNDCKMLQKSVKTHKVYRKEKMETISLLLIISIKKLKSNC